MTEKKKLIEVALPLEAINRESAREKSIRHGHPSTLHLWWARRPLAACRATIFASLVDDPSSHPDRFPTEAEQDQERERLFKIIEQLVKWENSFDPATLALARTEIERSTDGNPPAILDPFCGGGAIPIEAQRLGLRSLAGDLNPVAVLITKGSIEIPARFWDRPPVHPGRAGTLTGASGQGASGLAADIRHYGELVRERALDRLGEHYPAVRLPDDQSGGTATVIAWVWARTVQSPNPAWPGKVPLVRTWELATRPGKPRVWVEPTVDAKTRSVTYSVKSGDGAPPEGTVARGGGRCLATGVPIPLAHIKAAGMAGELGADLIAVVAEGRRGRIYLSPDDEQMTAAQVARPTDVPRMRLSSHPQYMGTPRYGLDDLEDLFSDRQLLALTTFSRVIREIRDEVLQDAVRSGVVDDGVRLAEGGSGATAYADALATYLAFALDKCTDYWSNVCSWHTSGEKMRNTFARQAIPMAWDFTEANPFSSSSGNWMSMVEWVWKAVEGCVGPNEGEVVQMDATARVENAGPVVVCTDPPYYDNVPYADISDFFYAWLRQNLADVWPNELSTLATPKQQELVADYQRHGSKEAAKKFFEAGVQEVFAAAAAALPPGYPLTIFYAFKAAETDAAGGQASTGWETFLQGVIDSGLSIESTWPMRTELVNRPRAIGAGALATSVVLACRPRQADAAVATRKEFLAALRSNMPAALRALQTGNIAPIDLPQAAIGPGMRVFSRYAKVVEADGSPMRVRQALAMINEVLGDVLFNQEGDFDPASRWAISWFEQFSMNPGPFGQADNLARAKATAVDAIVRSGVAVRNGDKVRLVDRDELPVDWDPTTDERLTVWEVTQHLLRRLHEEGETGAAALLRRVGGMGDLARELGYLLYGICERKGWTQEGLTYNGLVVSWPEISRIANAGIGPQQQELL